MEGIMKIPVLIMITLFLMFPGNIWGQQVRTFKGIEDRGIKSMASKNKQDWTKGVMTEITDKSVVINGKEYRLSPDTVIRYQGGEIIKNIKAFKASQSTNVSARIHGSSVMEIVIEGLELRY